MEAENFPFEELTKRHIRKFNENKVFESIKPRRAMWQMMLGDVSEDEVRAILGENIVRILKLDAGVIHDIAEKVGPTLEEIVGHPRDLPEPLLAHFAKRGDYLRSGEGEARVQEMRDMLGEDIWRVSALV